jgi:hypothetical protein
MLEASPYIIVIMAVLLLVFIGGFLWICWLALRSGMAFEGEIKNRLLSMKFRTSHPPPEPGTIDGQPVTPAEPEEGAR